MSTMKNAFFITFLSPPTQLSRKSNTAREFKQKILEDHASSQQCIREKSNFFPHSDFNRQALI